MTESNETREMTFDEEYEILQVEKNKLFAKEKDEETPFANCVVRRALRCIRKLLEEIQQYRAIGTVEELKSMKENGSFSGVELAQIAIQLNELKEYKKIGTIERFRELTEKAEPKKPINIRPNDTLSAIFDCPSCGRTQKIQYQGFHCKECGQNLDWE